MPIDLKNMSVLPFELAVSYDPDADAAYIFLSAADSASTLVFGQEMPDWLLVDLDEDGVVVGFEILGAKDRLGL